MNKQQQQAQRVLTWRDGNGKFLLGLRLLASASALVGIDFLTENEAIPVQYDHPLLDLSQQQFHEYMLGQRQQFSLPLDPRGTDFQLQVWQAMVAIPYGKTKSYGELAAALGDSRKARAVGQAANRNPLPIVIPCHRVVGKNGKLTGFAGGLSVKELLLNHEAKFVRH